MNQNMLKEFRSLKIINTDWLSLAHFTEGAVEDRSKGLVADHGL